MIYKYNLIPYMVYYAYNCQLQVYKIQMENDVWDNEFI